jgi:hypothetical protein
MVMTARTRMSPLCVGWTIIALGVVCVGIDRFLREGMSVPEDFEEKPERVDQAKLRTYLDQPQENLGNKLSNDSMIVMKDEKKNHSKILSELLPELEVGIDQIRAEDRNQTIRLRPSPTGIPETVGTSKPGNKLSNDSMMVMTQEKKIHSEILAELLPELEVGIDQILDEDRNQTMDVRMRPSPTGILEAVGTSKPGNKLSNDTMMVMMQEKKNHSKILAELLPELEVGIDQILDEDQNQTMDVRMRPSVIGTSKLGNKLSNDTTTVMEEEKKDYRKILSKLIPELRKAGIDRIKDEDRRKHFEHLVSVHLSDYPTRTAGRWVEKPPSLAIRASPALLQCLDTERQGNCHSDDDENRKEDSRSGKKHNYNSPGIMKGYDPYMWESDDEAYAVLPLVNGTSELLRGLKRRKIFIIGDSLSRQWAKSLSCELEHAYGYTTEVKYCNYNTFPKGKGLDGCLGKAKSRDYIVFNFGHHVGPGKYPDWRKTYTALMKRALHDLTTKCGHIPPDHIFFRTTSVRHFRAGMGDWNTNTSERGAFEADMDAKWDEYGGENHVLPIQNLLGLTMVGTQSNFSVLDVSPIMLGRADSTFDGSHFCLPGPMTEWTRMLLHRILS